MFTRRSQLGPRGTDQAVLMWVVEQCPGHDEVNRYCLLSKKCFKFKLSFSLQVEIYLYLSHFHSLLFLYY
jgi:hypothetical protein